MNDPSDRKVCSREGCHQLLPPKLVSAAFFMDKRWRHHYRKLDDNEKEIRLFKLKPGSSPELEGELFCTPLFESAIVQEENVKKNEAGDEASNTNEKFLWRALSYVWGAPPTKPIGSGDLSQTDTKDQSDAPWIRLNGERLPIGRNLYKCLLSLRSHSYFEPIWIDAICINQNDHIERSSQVLMMQEIYRCAGEVLVCIPFGHDRTSAQGITRRSTLAEILETEPSLYFALSDWGHGVKDHVYFQRVAEVLRDDYEHSYWKRLWTIQECVFARSLSVIHGDLKLSWDDLRSVRQTAAMMAIQYQVEGQTPGLTQEERRKFIRKIRLLTSASVSNREELRKGRAGLGFLEVLLSNCPASKCGDARDYIYGLMAVAESSPSSNSAIMVDYSLCTLCTWRNAAVSIIRETRTLDLLAVAGFGPDDRSIEATRPSWVPAWENIAHKRNTSRHSFSVPFLEGAKWHFSSDFRTLIVSGIGIGYVAGPYMEAADRDSRDGLHGQQHIAQLKRFLYAHLSDESHRLRCLEDLASLVTESIRSETPVDVELVRKACLGGRDLFAADESDEDGKELGSIYSDIAMILLKRQIILMSLGSGRPWLGLGDSPHARQGDAICGVAGCDTALVVQRLPIGDRILGVCLIPIHVRTYVLDEVHSGKRDLETFQFI